MSARSDEDSRDTQTKQFPTARSIKPVGWKPALSQESRHTPDWQVPDLGVGMVDAPQKPEPALQLLLHISHLLLIRRGLQLRRKPASIGLQAAQLALQGLPGQQWVSVHQHVCWHH